MSALPLGTGEDHRTYGRLPHIRLRNIFLERDPSNSVDGLVRLQRPGLAPWLALGVEPIDYIWRQEGTFGGDYLVASGGVLHRVTTGGSVTVLGSIGLGMPQIAARQDDALIVNGGSRYLTDGATITLVISPVGAPAQSVAAINSFYIIARRDSQIFDWIEPGATVIDPLNFASAERTPDDIEAVAVRGDEVWFLGRAGEEVWVPNSDPLAPFVRISGRVYSNGCLNRNTVVSVEDALVWVSPDREIMFAQGVPQIISSNALSERLRLSRAETMRAWTFKFDQHPFYSLTCDFGTFAYDFSMQVLCQLSSYDREDWLAHVGAQHGTRVVCGSSEAGKLWRMDPARSDDDGENLVREVTAGLDHSGPAVRCDSVSLRMAAGWSPSPSFEPRIEMRWSDDGGNIWVDWRPRGLGMQGQYDQKVVWRKLGLVKEPGRIFQFRMTDDAIFRLSYARMNETYG